MSSQLSKSALVLLGHGSTLNSDSSVPTYQHAEALRKKNIFNEVAIGFWKEEPNFRQTLRQVDAEEVYIVPNFISSGYFTEQVIPRELALTGPITRIGQQNFYYCPPVGLHIAMEEALLQRARSVVEQSGADLPHPEKTACLFICGHGTNFNDNSTKIIYERAQSIKARGLYADCQQVLMEQKPFVKNWATLTDCPDVIVVPFFIADGLHSYDDIPVLLGVTPNMRTHGFTNPHHFEGPPSRRLWYASAIGNEPFLTEVILQQVESFQKEHLTLANTEAELGNEINNTPPPHKKVILSLSKDPCLPSPPSEIDPAAPQKPPLLNNAEKTEKTGILRQAQDDSFVGRGQNDALVTFLKSAQSPVHIGQVEIRTLPDEKEYELRHLSDSGRATEDLHSIHDETALRQIINLDADGNFRPLHAAPTLASGWVWTRLNITQLRLALDYLYPAAISNWHLHGEGQLPVTHWKETAERQTGRFKIVRELSADQAKEVVHDYCHARCGKTRLWAPAAELNLPSPYGADPAPGKLTLWCPEACNPFVGKAREKLKGPESD